MQCISFLWLAVLHWIQVSTLHDTWNPLFLGVWWFSHQTVKLPTSLLLSMTQIEITRLSSHHKGPPQIQPALGVPSPTTGLASCTSPVISHTGLYLGHWPISLGPLHQVWWRLTNYSLIGSVAFTSFTYFCHWCRDQIHWDGVSGSFKSLTVALRCQEQNDCIKMSNWLA